MSDPTETGAAAWVLFKPYDCDGPVRVYLDEARAKEDFAIVSEASRGAESSGYELKEVPGIIPLT